MAGKTIKLNLDVDSSKGTAAIKKVKSGVKDLGKEAKTTGNSMSSISFSKIAKGGVAIAAVAAAFYGLTKAISAVNRAMKDCINLAGIQEAAESNLAAVLKATGNAAGYNTSELHNMAAAMQSVTTVGDEVIINAMAILATFKKVKGQAFEDTMNVALDMSQVLKKDLNSSIVMIGKAMNDPIRGMAALSLAGVQFTDDQKDMVETLIDSNDFIGAQAIVLKELESQFKGAATAARETFGGAMTATGNAFGDLKEQLGFVITKNTFFITLLTKMEDKFITWGKYIEDNRLALSKLAKDGLMTVISYIKTTVQVIFFLSNAWQSFKMGAMASIFVIVAGLKILYDALRSTMLPIDLICKGLKAIGVIDENPFDKVSANLEGFVDGSKDLLGEYIKDFTDSQQTQAVIMKKFNDTVDALKEIPVTTLTPEEEKKQKKKEDGKEELIKKQKLADAWATYKFDLDQRMLNATGQTQEAELKLLKKRYDDESKKYEGMEDKMKQIKEVFTAEKKVIDDKYTEQKANNLQEIADKKTANQEEEKANHEKVLQYISTEEESAIRAIESERVALLLLATTEAERREINTAADKKVHETKISDLQKWAEASKSTNEILTDIATSAASSFASGFTDAFTEFAEGTKSAEDAFKDFAKSFLKQIASMIVEALMLKLIQDSIAGLGGGGGSISKILSKNADGNVFNHGNKMMEYAKGAAFAAGGIVDQPTLFPMKKGMGLMGEAGPEAIMPLKRGSNGKLGVESSGDKSEKGEKPVIINVNYAISAIDSKSFIDTCRRNPEAISGTFIEEIQRGNTGLRNAINIGGR